MRTTMRFAAVVAIALLAACGNEPATETEAPIAQETVAPTPTPTPPATDDAGPCESTSAKSFEGRALIMVTEPCAGDTISSPVRRGVKGQARLLEREPVDVAIQDPVRVGCHLDGEAPQAHHGAKPGEISVPAGETRSTTYTFTEAGPLLIGCHLPTHYDYGMRGAIDVQR